MSKGAHENQVFGSAYADAYDFLYRDKDYAAECDLIEHVFQTYGDGGISGVLDLGCGTGSHAIPLAERGHHVVGVDRSASMLAHARRRLTERPGDGSAVFHQGDIRRIDLQSKFDAVLMMFAVLGYQLENSDVLAALQAARRHLRGGGLLLFDVWYGPAVLHQRPSERLKVIPTSDGKILRAASGELDTSRHVCVVRYHLWQLKADRLVAETEESHAMRFFFPLELDLFLEHAGFTPVRLGAFPDFDRDPDEDTWNVFGVARAD